MVVDVKATWRKAWEGRLHAMIANSTNTRGAWQVRAEGFLLIKIRVLGERQTGHLTYCWFKGELLEEK
jgi:hypothetical protein